MAADHVAFVRAVMIGREGLHAAVLVEMFERAGATAVRSHLATGNVSFGAGAGEVDPIVADVEERLAGLLGRATPLYVRSVAELRELVERDHFDPPPFPDVAGRIATLFRTEVPGSIEVPMDAPNGDWRIVAASHREVFSVIRAWPDRQAQDPGGVIQRLAGEPVTTRAIGTIEHLVAKLS